MKEFDCWEDEIKYNTRKLKKITTASIVVSIIAILISITSIVLKLVY